MRPSVQDYICMYGIFMANHPPLLNELIIKNTISIFLTNLKAYSFLPHTYAHAYTRTNAHMLTDLGRTNPADFE